MGYKIILFADKKIVDRICNFPISDKDNFEIVYISDSYNDCFDKLIHYKEDVVIIFQTFHPIYKVQDFFSDLAEVNLSPILFAFTIVSDTEIIYSITSHIDSVFLRKLQNLFTTSLKDVYTCRLNCISDNKNTNIIMNSIVGKLEKTEYLKDILRGVTDEEFVYYKKKVGLHLKNSGYYLYIWNLVDIEYHDHDLNKNIYYIVGEILINECEEVLNLYNGGEVFYINPAMLCIIVNHEPSNSQATSLRMMIEREKKLNTVMQCKTSFRYKSTFLKSIKDIRKAYEEYHQVKAYNFFCSDTNFLTYDYINEARKDFKNEAVNDLLHQIKEIINHNIADSRLITLINKLYLDIIKPSLSYDLYFYCYTFLSGVILERFGYDYHHIFPKNNFLEKLFFSSIEQQCNDFIEALHLLKGELSNRHMIKSPLVLEVIHFIQKSYMNDLSISFIAEKLNISHSYLSQVFTKEMGISPINYLITYRIQKAKELIISSDEPVYLIALNVGFTDVKHFSKTFRKITGVTPSQFKKQYSKAEYI